MKIAYIIPSLESGGPTNVLFDLVEVMISHGHECVIFYFDNKVNTKIFPCRTVQIDFFEKFNYSDFDIVHTHGFRPDAYNFIHKPIFTNNTVSTIHNFVFENLIIDYGYIKGIIGSLIWLFVRLRSDILIVLSSTAFSYYSCWFRSKKLKIVYNTRILDLDSTIPVEDNRLFEIIKSQYKFICCSLCRITNVKGLDTIIRALTKLENDICYVIIGDGELRLELEKLAISLDVSDRVFFLGNKVNAYAYLQYIDLFCIPSLSEGFPLAMLEAASLGKAIVASNLPVFNEIFPDGEIEVFENRIPEIVAKTIKNALVNKNSLEKAVKIKFENTYSPDCFYQRHFDIYSNIKNG